MSIELEMLIYYAKMSEDLILEQNILLPPLITQLMDEPSILN